jgi:hypothetical protein
METTTAMIVAGVYLLFVGLFLFIWYQFHEFKKNYWSKRNFDYIKEPIRPIDLTPRPSKHGLRVKPKYRSDNELFEIEKNPPKR